MTCGFPSSVSDATCVLPLGHQSDSSFRFHRFTTQGRPTMDRESEEQRKVHTVERALGPRNQFEERPSRELTDEEVLEEAFRYHPPEGSSAKTRAYATIRASGRALALTILQSVPRCADRTAAIRKVREAVMTANAAVALDGLI